MTYVTYVTMKCGGCGAPTQWTIRDNYDFWIGNFHTSKYCSCKRAEESRAKTTTRDYNTYSQCRNCGWEIISVPGGWQHSDWRAKCSMAVPVDEPLPPSVLRSSHKRGQATTFGQLAGNGPASQS